VLRAARSRDRLVNPKATSVSTDFCIRAVSFWLSFVLWLSLCFFRKAAPGAPLDAGSLSRRGIGFVFAPLDRSILIQPSEVTRFASIPNWLCFGAFLSPPARSPSDSLATILALHAPRPTPPSAGTSGVKVVRRDPAPLATACHRPPNCQKPNGPDLDEQPSISVCHRTRRFLRTK